jgi:EmrB/QacA subfamily drug resistance transporter
MACLDASIIVVGLPTVVEDLNASLFLGIWVIAGYGLAMTILLVAIGRLTDIVGRVKLYNLGFAIFTIGSALCALSQDVEMLIAFRLVQGLGGAFILANALAIVTDSFPAPELGTAIGIHQMAINAGTIMGYTLSGVMIGLFGWRSIFWLNVPVGFFATFWCHKRLKEFYVKIAGERFDYVGAVTFSTALTMLLLAMTGDLREFFFQLILGGSGVLFVVFFLLERRVKHPVLDLNLFKIRTFTAGNVSNLLNVLAFGGLVFELTLYLQLVRGFSALQAGIALLPIDVTMILVGPISGRLSDKYGPRGLTLIGLAITSVAAVMCANFSLDSTFTFVFPSLAAAGAGTGLFRSPNASSIMGAVSPDRRGIANGVRTTVISSANAVGIPLAMALMTSVLPYDKLASIVNADILSNKMEVLGLLHAMSYAFYALAFINLLGAIASTFRNKVSTRQ